MRTCNQSPRDSRKFQLHYTLRTKLIPSSLLWLGRSAPGLVLTVRCILKCNTFKIRNSYKHTVRCATSCKKHLATRVNEYLIWDRVSHTSTNTLEGNDACPHFLQNGACLYFGSGHYGICAKNKRDYLQ